MVQHLQLMDKNYMIAAAGLVFSILSSIATFFYTRRRRDADLSDVLQSTLLEMAKAQDDLVLSNNNRINSLRQDFAEQIAFLKNQMRAEQEECAKKIEYLQNQINGK